MKHPMNLFSDVIFPSLPSKSITPLLYKNNFCLFIGLLQNAKFCRMENRYLKRLTEMNKM